MLRYHLAGAADIDLLLKARLEMLQALGSVPQDGDIAAWENSCRSYYLDSLRTGSHVACLVFSNEAFAGCGGICFYQVVPSLKNPSGMKAYILNIYTVPQYRDQGIATRVVDMLVCEALARGIRTIGLEATEEGRPVYERYGFVMSGRTMVLTVPEAVKEQT